MPVLGVIFLRHATNRYHAALRKRSRPTRPPARCPSARSPQGRFHQAPRPPAARPPPATTTCSSRCPQRRRPRRRAGRRHERHRARFRAPPQPAPEGLRPNSTTPCSKTCCASSTARRCAPLRGDVFGRINEYFLMKFAMQGAQDNGEFFTPPSLVQTIVNVIEPDHGVVFDPACGSGGMFVQSSHFIAHAGRAPCTASPSTARIQDQQPAPRQDEPRRARPGGRHPSRPTPSTTASNTMAARCGATATSSWPIRPSTSTWSMPSQDRRTTAACPSACPA
jgi:hypothetical protein